MVLAYDAYACLLRALKPNEGEQTTPGNTLADYCMAVLYHSFTDIPVLADYHPILLSPKMTCPKLFLVRNANSFSIC